MPRPTPAAPAAPATAPFAAHAAEPVAPSPAARATRAATLVALVALIALCLAWELWLAPLRPGGSWLAIKALPLLLPLPGIVRYRMFTYRALALFIWLYFVEGVVRSYGDRGLSSTLALIEVLLVVVLFTACTAHIRLRLRQAMLAAKAQA